MSIYRITPDDLEYFTIVANPKRTYQSSSSGAVTGSIFIYDNSSNREKDLGNYSPYVQVFFSDNNIPNLLGEAKAKAELNHVNTFQIRQYMTAVNALTKLSRKSKKALIKRFEPGVIYSKDIGKKKNIKDVFLPEYRVIYPNSHFSYTNYNVLNFFTSSLVPSNSVLIYPNSSSNGVNGTFVSGAYCVPSGWTFDFYINPRYQNDQAGANFNAGTIFHLSSTYCVSLITGSLVDSRGLVDGFRIQLQLSHSANVTPSLGAPGVFPNDLIFRSPDNSLRKNHWHHVSIRWGTNTVDNGTGSFFIDGLEVGNFVIPSSTILPRVFTGFGNPNALCIGNYYQGTNSGTSAQSVFFDSDTTTNEGLLNLSSLSQNGQPTSYQFNNPLNAELHELKIYNRWLSNDEIVENTKNGIEDLESVIFYVPPFFVKESPKRRILSTPFVEVTSESTDTPFNVSMSFGVKGYLINLENFTRDLSTGLNPRLLNLTGSVFSNLANTTLTANEILYSSSSIRKRNLTILPCDNGKFFPNFAILQSGSANNIPNSSSNHSRFVDDLGVLNLGFVSLNNLVSTSSIIFAMTAESGAMFRNATGVDPEHVSGTPTDTLAVLQRLRDPSSNEISMFNISDLFYGNRINPKTFKVIDSSITGSGDKISITIKDDGIGNLYRADSITQHATWASVGNIFYNEGVAIIKTPHLSKFGKDQFSMEFEGEQTVHVLKIISELPANMVNSSSNPDFIPISASLLANDDDNEFVYITNVYYLDDNFNVLMKTNLAQPLKKRSGDKFILKSAIDF